MFARVPLWCVLAAAACAPVDIESALNEAQELNQEAIQSWLEHQTRALEVALPLLVANTDLCEQDVTTFIGLFVATEHALGDDIWNAADIQYGVDDGVTIFLVVPGSPAAEAGFQPGDKILAIAGRPLLIIRSRTVFSRNGPKSLASVSLYNASSGFNEYRSQLISLVGSPCFR